MKQSLLPVNYVVPIAFALSLAACGDGGGGGGSPPTQNRAPVISSAATASVVENEALDYTVTASDPDAVDVLSLSLGGPDTGVFSLGSANGALRFVSPPDYWSVEPSGS